MTGARHLCPASGLLGAPMRAAPASAVPAGPCGPEAAPTSVVQARMKHGDRMRMRDRMMRGM